MHRTLSPTLGRKSLGFFRHRFGWLLVLLCLAVVTLGSLSPSWRHLFHVPGRFHLPAHVAAFAFCAFLAFAVTPPGRHLLWCLALAALALSLEVSEHLIYGYRFEWRDCLADLLGLLIALLVLAACRAPGTFDRPGASEGS